VYPTIEIGPLPLLPWTTEPLALRSYVVARLVAIGAAGWLTVRLGRRAGIARRDMLAVVLAGVPLAILAAHLLAVLESGGYRVFDAGIAAFWRTRSAIFGALAGGVAWAALYAAWRGLDLRRILDAGAPAMALGEGITRIGCLLAGCCYGRPTDGPLGLAFPRASAVYVAQVREGLLPPRGAAASLAVHPTQVYAALFGFGLCWILLRALRRPERRPGEVFCLFLFAYGLWRFVLFYLRGDPGPVVALGLHASQIAALAAIATAMALERWWQRAPGPSAS